MKKLLYGAAALAMLFFASCQQENLEPAVNGGVTYTITIPTGAQTKGANGYEKYDLYVEVYRTVDAEELETASVLIDEKFEMIGHTKEVTLELLNDQDYTILFWANKAGQDYFDASNLRNVGIKTAASNNDDRDAFCGKDQVSNVNASYSRSVELRRPFAQLNIATVVSASAGYDLTPTASYVRVSEIPVAYNVATGTPAAETYEVEFEKNFIPGGTITFDNTEYTKVAMNYVLVPDSNISVYYEIETVNGTVKNTIDNVNVEANYRTYIIGNLLTSNATYRVEVLPEFADAAEEFNGGKYVIIDGEVNAKVETAEEFMSAFDDENVDVIVLTDDFDFADLFNLSRSVADNTLTIKSGKTLTIDLNGKKLSATSTQAGTNYNMFDVRGNLTVKNGTIEYKHVGENMGWNASTNIFNVTAGGVLNLKDVTAKNLGGSDMGFVAHLNNWGEVTLNVENCTLESNYVPVRVFNSGPDMNNVSIKNSTLNGVSAAFWVHNYTVADFGTEAKVESQKALLNLNIYNQGNKFTPDIDGIRYGFTNSIRTDAYGITKTVSADGTEVTLGSVVENGLIRRGVAGAEENTTITKVVVEEGVGVLYDRTFRRFKALETVELPSTLTTIGAAGSGVFQSCTSLKYIVLPESVTVLGNGSFHECSSLESINIPAGVTRIEADALRATGLKSVEFHAGVTYFGAQAFRDCKQLTEVIIKAPEFTMENNTFGSMAAPFTPMIIYVANPEMKAYVESMLTAHCKTYITVVAPSTANTNETLKEALATDAKIITVEAGEYTFPESSVKAGVTINCAEGTVFKGKSSLNIKGATVVGATFKNEGGQAVSGTINGNFKDCTFEGSETLRWCYTGAGTTIVFENCVVKTTLRGVHFDGMDGDVIFKNCEINGFNAYSGAGTITFEGCTFGHDASKYNGLNIYSNTILKDCQFGFVSGNTNFIDMEGTGKTLTIENCTATLDGAAAEISDFVGGSKLDSNTVLIK